MVLKTKNKSGEYSSLYLNSEKPQENFLLYNKKTQEDSLKVLPFSEE
jgi:hypothetical protein